MRSLPRVLFVTGAYAPEFSAGGLQSQAVARILHGRVRVKVLTTATQPDLPGHDSVEGVQVSRIRIASEGNLPRLLASARMSIELVRLLRGIDLVHLQGFSSKNILVTVLSKLFRRPVVMHLQTAAHDEPATVRAKGRLAWWAFRSADQYLSVSPGLTRRYLEAGLSAGRIGEVPNGVDPARFAPVTPDERLASRRRLNLPIDRPMVLFVGVISPDKQPQVLLEAWLRLQEQPATRSTLVFVGATDPALFELGGRLIDELRATVNSSGLADRVVFVPPTSQIQDYFRAADVYAMPSLREGLPIALLEAMACGLPCVASRLPGATDAVIQDGDNGRLVPPGDVGAFSAALAAVLADRTASARMGAAARRTVEERYTMERVAGMWLDAYHHVLARR